MRIVSISRNKDFHTLCIDNLNEEVICISSKKEKKEFESFLDDIVLFDLDAFFEVSMIIKKAKVLCVREKLDELEAFKFLKIGAKGYESKKNMALLEDILNTIKDDKIWVYPQLMSFIIKHSTIQSYSLENHNISKLSSKELEVAKLVSQGYTNNDIAKELEATLRTVKAHVSSCFVKLELKDRLSLAMLIKDFYR